MIDSSAYMVGSRDSETGLLNLDKAPHQIRLASLSFCDPSILFLSCKTAARVAPAPSSRYYMRSSISS
jgi:hypothetical protein